MGLSEEPNYSSKGKRENNQNPNSACIQHEITAHVNIFVAVYWFTTPCISDLVVIYRLHNQGKRRVIQLKIKIWTLILSSSVSHYRCCSNLLYVRFPETMERMSNVFRTYSGTESSAPPIPTPSPCSNRCDLVFREPLAYHKILTDGSIFPAKKKKSPISCRETLHSFNRKEFVCYLGSSQMHVKEEDREMINAVISELKEQ